ncbi:MAG: hypothetical protein NTW87_35415, partial [Planctomycetota bacterium]|nr:hypothetical protein [Planctomycetota bacterium]
MTASKALKGFLFPFVNTSVGRKIVMSWTGLGAIGFLIVHILGNTVVYGGPAAFNGYAHSLHALPFLPLLEIALGLLFLTHITMGIVLTFQNLAARPIGYAVTRSHGAKTVASTTMIYTGLTILAYMLLHVWTVRIAPGEATPAFDRVTVVLANRWYAVAYLVGLVALAFHVSHGASSALLSLGLRHPLHDPWVDLFGKIGAVVLSATFATIVVCFMAWGAPWPGKHVDTGAPAPVVPDGPLPEKWERHRGRLQLVSPGNKRKYHLIVVGTGLAGA